VALDIAAGRTGCADRKAKLTIKGSSEYEATTERGSPPHLMRRDAGTLPVLPARERMRSGQGTAERPEEEKEFLGRYDNKGERGGPRPEGIMPRKENYIRGSELRRLFRSRNSGQGRMSPALRRVQQ